MATLKAAIYTASASASGTAASAASTVASTTISANINTSNINTSYTDPVALSSIASTTLAAPLKTSAVGTGAVTDSTIEEVKEISTPAVAISSASTSITSNLDVISTANATSKEENLALSLNRSSSETILATESKNTITIPAGAAKTEDVNNPSLKIIDITDTSLLPRSACSANSSLRSYTATSKTATVESIIADKLSFDTLKEAEKNLSGNNNKKDNNTTGDQLCSKNKRSDSIAPVINANGHNMFSEVFEKNAGTELESGALEDSNCSLIEGGLEKNCKICSSRLQSPRILSCLHVFCETCLNKLLLGDSDSTNNSSSSSTASSISGDLMQQRTLKNQIECPICKQVTQIGQGGVQSLTCDYVLTNILDVASIESEKLFCTSCKSKENAISRCNDCANFLCGGCDKAHRFMRCFENHEVLKLEDLQKTSLSDGKPLIIHKPLYCNVHISENLKYYCFNCQIPVCNDCLIADHKGNDHHYEVIGVAEKSVRGDVENLIKEAQIKVQYCDNAAANLSTALTELQTQHDLAYDLIQDTFEKCRKVLEKCRDQSLAELEKLHSERELKIMDLMQSIENTMGKIENSCKFTNRVLEQANAAEFLSMKKLIAAQFINLINMTPKCDINYSLNFDTKLDKFEQMAQEVFGKFRTESTPPSPKESTPPPTLPGMPLNIINMNGRSGGLNCSSNSQGNVASSVTASSPISLPTSMQSSFDGDLSVLGNGFIITNVLTPDSPQGSNVNGGGCNNVAAANVNSNGNQHFNPNQHHHTQRQFQHQNQNNHQNQSQHHHQLQQQISTSSSHGGSDNGGYHGNSVIGPIVSSMPGNTLNNILSASPTGLNGPLGGSNQIIGPNGLNGLIGGGGSSNINGLGSGGPIDSDNTLTNAMNNTLTNGPTGGSGGNGATAGLGNSLGCNLNGINNDSPLPSGYSSILEYNLSRLASLTENTPETLNDPLISGITNDQSVVSAAAQNQPITLADLLNGDQRAFNNLQALAKLGLNGDFHTDMTSNQILSGGPSPTGIDCLLPDYCLSTVTSPNLQNLPPLNGPGHNGGNVGGPGPNGPTGPNSANVGVGLGPSNNAVVDINGYHGPPSLPHNSTNILTGRSKATPMQIRCKFGSLGTSRGHFNSPHGFCLGVNEEIIVADTNNHRIQVFDKCGNLNFYFGVPGKEEGQLWYPRKVAVMPANGKFVVCDRGNERSRMQIFSKSGHFIRKIAIRYIDIVAGLAVTSKGYIVAVDSVSPTVFVISEEGELVRWFDCSDYMREPSDIAIRDKDFYVCDFKGHCVAVFHDDGTFRYRIGNEKVTCFPNGIDISNAGDILIGDSHGNRFHVACYSREGILQSEFECPHVKVSRCCGLKITSEGYVVTLAKNNHHVLVLNTLYVQ